MGFNFSNAMPMGVQTVASSGNAKPESKPKDPTKPCNDCSKICWKTEKDGLVCTYCLNKPIISSTVGPGVTITPGTFVVTDPSTTVSGISGGGGIGGATWA